VAAHRPLHARRGRLRAGARGLLPEWSVTRAASLAGEVEAPARPDYRAFLERMYGDEPTRWDDRSRASTAARDRERDDAPARMRRRRRDGAQVQGRAGRSRDGVDAVVRRARPAQPRPRHRLRPLVGTRRALCGTTSALSSTARLRLGPCPHRGAAGGSGAVRGGLPTVERPRRRSDQPSRAAAAGFPARCPRPPPRAGRNAMRATTPRCPDHEAEPIA
jgi:hypothetical protein